jgi:hypothetical protein
MEGGVEEDPAAAFLAREQDELAGIADDTLGIGATDSTVSGNWACFVETYHIE